MASAATVLLIDDDAAVRRGFGRVLQAAGFRILFAENGASGLSTLAEASPDAVLLDLNMPGLDGWQVARILKSNPSTQQIIVVALTAHALARETQAARDAGCDGVISKPFELTALAEALPRLRTLGMKALDVPGLSLTVPPYKRPQAQATDQTEL